MNALEILRAPASSDADSVARGPAHVASALVPKLVCQPSRGHDPLKIGIFGGLHGDEEAGTHAIYELMRWAWNDPPELQDYELHLFPVCNPTGRRLRSRHTFDGIDLNREFWNGSQRSEVRYLEGELRRERYDGLISLHSDCDSPGIYGFASGAVLSENVLQPALAAAARVLPLNTDAVIDGFPAEGGIIREGYPGVLSAPPDQRPLPLEIVFETPTAAPMQLQVDATVLAVKAILAEYRQFQAFGANL
jgi:predicted deacylase